MEKSLVSFLQKTPALEPKDKLKIILVAASVKPATYIRLKIQKNLHDKHTFENNLNKAGLLFEVSRAKGFEEIKTIRQNAAVWTLNGVWYGYDIFCDQKHKTLFHTYKTLLAKQKHHEADITAGQLYGYPISAIMTYIKKHHTAYLRKNYTYYTYYKELHEFDKRFPFISHIPSRLQCKESKKLNELYQKTIKKEAPKLYAEYTKKRTYHVPVIVDSESEIPKLWKKRTAHDYCLITARPIENNYKLISWLSKKQYTKGSLLNAKIQLQYNYATVRTHYLIGILPQFHHERHFTKL